MDMPRRMFLTGNRAIALAALDSGLGFYAGYPITPSSDLMEYIAVELPRRGGVFIQAEDELASINMVIGASIAGAKSMTATSGPGYSLMQEGIGLAVMLEVPIVVVDITRLGPATGQATKAGQGDLMQARWGRHGDQYTAVFSASTVRDAYDITIHAFNVAESLRVPVTLLIDELTGHLWETVELPDAPTIVDRVWTDRDGEFFHSDNPSIPPPMPKLGVGLNVLYTGSTHDGRGFRKTQDAEIHSRLVRRLRDKVFRNIDKIFRFNVYPMDGEDVDIVFISYGSVSRSAMEATRILIDKGYRAKSIDLNTLWPMDYNLLRRLVGDSTIIIVPELCLGQLIYDVKMIAGGDRVYGYNKVGGGIPIYPSELVEYVGRVMAR